MEVLRAIKNPAQRDKDAKQVFIGFGARGDLQAARDAEKLITDDNARFEARLWFILGASDMEVARKALAELQPATDGQRRRAEGTAKMLDRRAENRAKKPPTAKELAEKASESNHASGWRAAAEAWREEDKPQRAREALGKAVALVDQIEHVSLRVGTLTLIANEYLELGDSPDAARVMKVAVAALEAEKQARKQDEADPAQQIPDILHAMLFSPPFIVTLARCGELKLAIEWAAPARQYGAVGAGCTSAKMQTELQRVLPTLDSACDRALACAGVAQGLLEKR